ncbi:MAG: 6-pyruvoyl-tetrahydropterin synthase-related protein [Candidatus Daviesbacteria bacterium]|nr:6-pyruvoyl-tetrahydropterin synthase-related protein [Candidatus Daviesbacteria bacterium]
MAKIFKNNIYLILVMVASLMISWPLFLPGYFSHHDDLQVMRIFEMRKCIEDLQIPCRWVPDMGYGNGYPLFNYYNPLPYYVGAILSFVLGYVISAKALFLIAIFLGGVSMFFLAKEIFGKEPAMVAAILYQLAPYKALDLYVRGALAESFALGIVPFCFLFVIKLLREDRKVYFWGLSLSLAALLISHNIMTLVFVPILLIFCIFSIFFEKSKNIRLLLFSLVVGLGLAAFFIIPSYFEKDLVQIDNLTRLDLDFRAHFATVNQLFLDRSWGYGASFPGPNDTISLQIGWPHWAIVTISFFWAIFSFKKANSKMALLFFTIFVLAIFMTHIRSAFVWEQIGILRFAQFPWRFLSAAIFTASLLGAYLISNINNKYKIYLTILIGVITIILNWNYFKPEIFYPNIGDIEKLSGEEWETQQKAAILDYLPQTGVQPREGAPANPLIINGQANISNFVNRSSRWKFNVDVDEKSRIEAPVFDFPKWRVFVDGKKIAHDNKNYLGRIAFELTEGEHAVEGKLENTPIRTLSNTITLISIIVLGLITLYGKNRKFFR